jgi:hypothetical protein
MIELDILTVAQATVIPEPRDLGFCFNATASTLNEFYGLTLAPQTIPASPAVPMRRNLRFLLDCVIQGCFTIALRAFPGLPICLRRQHAC